VDHDAADADREIDEAGMEMLGALEGVVDALQATCEEGEIAARHVEAFKAQDAGGANGAGLGEGGVDPVLAGSVLVRRLGAVQRRLGDAAARFRRSQARALRRRGMSTDGIAEQFGVTRQRVSRLLNSPPIGEDEVEPPT
jgi:hypothetical protein